MSKSSLKVAPALKPRSSLSLTGIAAALYPCTANTGSTITDRFGNYAAATMTGTAANPLSANPGWITLNGTDSYFNMDYTLWPNMASVGVFAFGVKMYRAADNGSAEMLFDVGSGSTIKGVFRIEIYGSGGVQVSSRGVGATAATAETFTGFDFTTYNAASDGVSLFFVMRGFSGLTCSIDLYVNGVYVSSKALDFGANGGSGFPSAVASGDVRVGATTGTAISFIGGGTASSRQKALFFHSAAAYDAVKIAALALERHLFPYEKSRVLAA